LPLVTCCNNRILVFIFGKIVPRRQLSCFGSSFKNIEIYQATTQSGTLAFLKPGPPLGTGGMGGMGGGPMGGAGPPPAVMQFIDDDLLWCPDNDGKMVDLSNCLESGTDLGELSNSDLSTLVPSLDEEQEDLFKQLAETSFELEQFFDFNDGEKEENNNNIIGTVGKNQATVALLQELQRNSASGRKFTIAAANPLLAEKLAAPAGAVPASPNCDTSSPFPVPICQIKTDPDSRQGRPRIRRLLVVKDDLQKLGWRRGIGEYREAWWTVMEAPKAHIGHKSF
ncbi:hypothetical protein LSTR_LSTR002355, partial [Laodelphax striatellus]